MEDGQKQKVEFHSSEGGLALCCDWRASVCFARCNGVQMRKRRRRRQHAERGTQGTAMEAAAARAAAARAAGAQLPGTKKRMMMLWNRPKAALWLVTLWLKARGWRRLGRRQRLLMMTNKAGKPSRASTMSFGVHPKAFQEMTQA